MVPHLTTALTGPLLELERQFLDNAPEIEKWFRTQWQDHMPPFYGSTDLRNSGFKLAPVDLNLFPGGFNNLSDAFMPLCVQAAQSAVERICPDASSLLLIPENHTRNQFYLQNVASLVSILRLTGLDVRVGSLLPDIVEPTVLELNNGTTLTLEPLRRSGNRLGLDNFDPCAVLLNNDLSAGIPPVLKGLDEQWVIPPLHAGWHVRRKSKHAECYDRVAREFATTIGIDPWRINLDFGVCGQINFQERTGEECLAAQVDALLTRIRAKYKEYGVTDEPFVVVKADAGTYGMGVMTVTDASEVIGLNRRQRNKMAVVKEGLQVHEVIIQEGVHTFETVEDGDQHSPCHCSVWFKRRCGSPFEQTFKQHIVNSLMIPLRDVHIGKRFARAVMRKLRLYGMVGCDGSEGICSYCADTDTIHKDIRNLVSRVGRDRISRAAVF